MLDKLDKSNNRLYPFRQGNVNVKHYLPLLEAEEAAYNGNDATRLYGEAISMAKISGFQHNAALASERFGEYLLHDLNDERRAMTYIRDAAQYYSAWGSDYKAHLLEEKYNI